MNRTDKIIIFFFVFLGISFSSAILYTDLSYRDRYPDVMNSTSILYTIEPIDHVIFEKTFTVDKKVLFETYSDIENYPLIMPKKILSVEIINQTSNTIVAKETISESGITTTLLVSHTIVPYDSHLIEVISGDAKGTSIHLNFDDGVLDSTTTVTAELDVELDGLLTPFRLLPSNNARHAMNTVMDTFFDYSQGHETLEEQLIDNIYRKILLRPADSMGLEHYVEQYNKKIMTLEEIENELQNSKEYANYLLLKDIQTNPSDSLKNLTPETIQIIHGLYQEILYRDADENGLLYYGTMLQNHQITENDIRNSLLNSTEADVIN